MSKVICDICGSVYQDTAEQCPICGCTRDAVESMMGDELLLDEVAEEPKAKSGKFKTKKKEIFDYDEANSLLQDEEVEEESYDEDDDEDEYDEAPRPNTFVVILLTILIVALLAVAGFLFVRYFLPAMGEEETPPVTTAAPATEAPVETTTEYVVPCQSLVLTSGTAELTQPGGYFLLNVIAMPEDTTDEIKFRSADESIATVSLDGRITAVGEGETVIYITCGSSQLNCPVVCKFEEETEPTTEPTTVPSEAETEPEETTAETTEAAKINPDVELKLKKTDIGLKVYYYVTLQLDCELEPTDIEWSSEHPHIATVDENGVVTAKKDGTTSITAKYGDQEVTCMVRCYY